MAAVQSPSRSVRTSRSENKRCLLFQATVNVIKNVVLEVVASNQKGRALEEPGSRPLVPEVVPSPALLQGEAELAYLTHEGLFISDALNEARQQQQAGQDPGSAVDSRIQQSRVEAADSASAAAEPPVSREQSFM